MPRQSGRPLLVATIVLAFLLAILTVGGLSLRQLIITSFQSAEQVRATRALSLETLKLQLDEETGIRGYAASHNVAFLQSYYAAQPKMVTLTSALRSAVAKLNMPATQHAVDDAADTNERWLRLVGEPLANHTSRYSAVTQQTGMALDDHFRRAIRAIDGDLAARELIIDSNAEASVNKIIFFMAATTSIVLVLTAFFATLQLRTARGLEDERQQAGEQRIATSELRAAYAAEKRIADTLQDVFSQRPLPSLPTLRFSAMYVPATDEARVGGDWYDALELTNDRVLFAIGDVTGHGLEAAVSMSRARQALIAAALGDPEPASVLQRVNLDLIRQRSPLVTAIVGYADTKKHEFVYSIAGHPPPLLLVPGGQARMLDFGALPLGAISDAEYQTYRVQAPPGSLLVLYTDGAVEHSRNVLDGEALLLQAGARAMESDSDEPARVIHDTIFAGKDADDDVAILTIGFAHEQAAGFTISAHHVNADYAGRIGGRPVPAKEALAS